MDVVRTQRTMARRSRTPPDSAAITEGEPSSTDRIHHRQSTITLVDNKPNSTKDVTRVVRRRGPLQRFRHHRRRRSMSAPPAPGRRRPLIEDHFRVDPDNRRVVLPGVPRHDPNSARDSHDFFNLVMLVPVVALNVMNWNWDMLLSMPKNKGFRDCWAGDWFELFFGVTALYFVIDLIWIAWIPSCVRSPATIIKHHLATMLYILVPFYYVEYRWLMGCCMIVEVNTWFLIARRVFNKQGFPPWIIDLSCVSIRVKLISIFFYLTWIAIRVILYPYIMVCIYETWLEQSAKVGTRLNVVTLCLPLHAVFCLLNLKWTYDLLMSKARYWRQRGYYKDVAASKGL